MRDVIEIKTTKGYGVTKDGFDLREIDVVKWNRTTFKILLPTIGGIDGISKGTLMYYKTLDIKNSFSTYFKSKDLALKCMERTLERRLRNYKTKINLVEERLEEVKAAIIKNQET